LGSFTPLSLAEDALPINLNTASAVDIAEAIDGVGEVRAAAIISLREELGGFTMLEQLLDVKGISEVTLARIRSIIVLE
jgi:competence protein ComEA